MTVKRTYLRMSVTSDEINFLLRRYLEEAGYPHTAFIFKTESMQNMNGLSTDILPPEAFLTILKKGMFYMQLEKAVNEKAKQNDNSESIILSILDATRNREPIAQSTNHNNNSKYNQNTQNSRYTNVQTVDPMTFPKKAALLLKAHSSVIYCCDWTPDGRYLATGSEDATAIIWEIRNKQYVQHFVLDHATEDHREARAITTLCWNYNGTLLATGSMDGTVRIFTNTGELRYILAHHKSSVYSIQFSPDGQYLLSAGQDSVTIVWNVSTGTIRQTTLSHTQSILEVDWLDSTTYASCSFDQKIAVCKVGMSNHIMLLEGHKGPVNSVAWSPAGQMLASCSDDATIRIWWPFEGGRSVTLNEHVGGVFVVKWCPTNSNILVSGSFDYTVKVWDVQKQQCLYSINKHKMAVFSLSFSPKGKFFVSAGMDKILYVWRVSDGSLIASYDAESEIYHTQWDKTGQSIAMCLNDANVAVLSTSNMYLYQE